MNRIRTRPIDPQCRSREQELALALARALGVPGKNATLIGVDNERCRLRHDPPKRLLRARRTPQISDLGRYWSLALDFDGKGKNTAEQAEADSHNARQLLAEAGISSVLCKSGPTGWHVLVRFDKPIMKSEMRKLSRPMRARWRTLDTAPLTNSSSAHIRPPLAPHRTGSDRSEPVEGAERALVILRDERCNAAQLKNLLKLLGGGESRPSVLLPGCTAYGSAALTREAFSLAETSEGRRHNTTFAKACSIGELVAGGEVDEGEAMRVLVDGAVASGLPEHEARQTVKDGLAAWSEVVVLRVSLTSSSASSTFRHGPNGCVRSTGADGRRRGFPSSST